MTITIIIYFFIILYIFLNSIYLYTVQNQNQNKNKKFFFDLLSYNALPLYLNQKEIFIFIFSINFFLVIFLNLTNVAYCMDLKESWDFDINDIKFLHVETKKSEQNAVRINQLNNLPTFFKSQSSDLNSCKISYSFIFDFKKHQIPLMKEGQLIYGQYGMDYDYLYDFEKKFKNIDLNDRGERLKISLEILIKEHEKKFISKFKHFSLKNENKIAESLNITPIQTRDQINKMILNTNNSINSTYDILYCIKSHPYLTIDQKKYLLKIFKKGLINFLTNYECIENFLIQNLPQKKENFHNKEFFNILSNFHKLNTENLKLLKSMSIARGKKYEDIQISNFKIPESSVLVDYSSGEELALFLDGNVDSPPTSPFSFEMSDLELEEKGSLPESKETDILEEKGSLPESKETDILKEKSSLPDSSYSKLKKKRDLTEMLNDSTDSKSNSPIFFSINNLNKKTKD